MALVNTLEKIENSLKLKVNSRRVLPLLQYLLSPTGPAACTAPCDQCRSTGHYLPWLPHSRGLNVVSLLGPIPAVKLLTLVKSLLLSKVQLV